MEIAPSLITALIIMLYFYYIDPNKEPVKRLIEAFIIGFAVSLQIDYLQNIIPKFENYIVVAFISAGLIEEGVKLLALQLTLFRSRFFTQKIDGITYAVFLALGFAIAENLVLVQDVSIGIIRAFTSTPAHALFAVSMGFYVGKYKFKENKKYLLLALFIPVMLHGVYNLLIFSQSLWGLLIFFPYVAFLWWKATAKHKYLRR